jgi:hypothetical protein
MSEEAIKQRQSDAKSCAKKFYKSHGFKIYNSDNEIICFTAKKGSSNGQKITQVDVRVVIDKIEEHDIELIKGVPISPNETKVIFCKIYKCQDPKILEYDFLNNLCQ